MENFASMPPRERAGYFIRRVADFEEVWGILLDKTLYVWPEPEFAEVVMPKLVSGLIPKLQRFDVYVFINEFIPKLVEQNANCLVFYGVDGKCITYSPKEMKEALEDELKQYM